METLAYWTARGLTLLLSAFAILVAVRMLTGEIRLRGLLRDTTPRREFSPVRVQLLVFTLAAAGEYLAQMMHRPEDSGLPVLSGAMVQFLGASQAIYAGRKFWQRIAAPLLARQSKGTP